LEERGKNQGRLTWGESVAIGRKGGAEHAYEERSAINRRTATELTLENSPGTKKKKKTGRKKDGTSQRGGN